MPAATTIPALPITVRSNHGAGTSFAMTSATCRHAAKNVASTQDHATHAAVFLVATAAVDRIDWQEWFWSSNTEIDERDGRVTNPTRIKQHLLMHLDLPEIKVWTGDSHSASAFDCSKALAA